MNTAAVVSIGFLGAIWLYGETERGNGAYYFDIAADTVSSAIRGIRNNNPGNIVKSSIEWQGLSADQSSDARFAQFDSMYYGIRALSRNLLSYFNRGLATVSQIIRTWSATDQDVYVTNVANYLGVSPNDYIDVSNDQTRAALVRAIIRQECGLIGSALISDSQILEGVTA